MWYTTAVIFALASATAVLAVPNPQQSPTATADVDQPENTMWPGYPAGFYKEPKIVDVGPRSPGGIIQTQRHGPYNLKAGATVNTFGSITNPCTKECTVTAFEGDLVYEDGTPANVNTGAWLHHMVFMATGPGKKDYVCGGFPGYGRWFGVGNERTTTRLDVSAPHGRKMNKGDTMSWMMELMNESDQALKVYLITRFEYTYAEGYKDVAFLWLDATGCYGSNVPAQEGAYQLKSPVWKSTVAGRLLKGGGHVHDGGVEVEIYKNGQLICDIPVFYGKRPEYIAPASDGHVGHGGAESISDIGSCVDYGRLNVGDELQVISYYNSTAHPQFVHDGKPHPVMGIGNLWVGLD